MLPTYFLPRDDSNQEIEVLSGAQSILKPRSAKLAAAYGCILA